MMSATRICSIEGCNGPHSAKGLCVTHYNQSRVRRQSGCCSVADCDRPLEGRGMCAAHYTRLRRGIPIDATPARPKAKWGKPASTLAALLTVETDECILWPHGTEVAGYGEINVGGGRVRKVHVIACEHRHGPRPEGMQAAHCQPDGSPCVSRRCMNYRHLRWATPAENYADSVLHGTAVGYKR